jgi:hypothetical protein
MDDSKNTISNKNIIKRCIKCQRELPIFEFGKRRHRSSKPDAHWIYSRYGECKECAKNRKALWRIKNPSYMKLWYIKHKQLNTRKNAI